MDNIVTCKCGMQCDYFYLKFHYKTKKHILKMELLKRVKEHNTKQAINSVVVA